MIVKTFDELFSVGNPLTGFKIKAREDILIKNGGRYQRGAIMTRVNVLGLELTKECQGITFESILIDGAFQIERWYPTPQPPSNA